MEEGRLPQSFKEDMLFFNDIYKENIFTLAIKRNNVKITLGVMKNLSLLTKQKIIAATESIPLI